MMYLIIDEFVQALSMSSEPILAPSRLGSKRPSSNNEIPAIAISLIIEKTKGTGLGRFIRAGDSLTKNTAVIEVKAGMNGFSNNMKSLHLAPLPLKKSPDSLTREFGEKDVSIRNVTEAVPALYQMVENPAQESEYRLDVANATVVFGAAQTQGEKLEVVHWTVAWRDAILGDSYSGSIVLELWANSSNEANDLSRKLQEQIKINRAVFRQKGFIKLQPASLELIEYILHQPTSGSPFGVWKQKLQYTFAFESEEGGNISSDGAIKRIDVNLGGQTDESMTLT